MFLAKSGLKNMWKPFKLERLYLLFNPRLRRVTKEATVIQELAYLWFQHSQKFLRLSSFHHLVVVKVDHLHRACMLRGFQVTLYGPKRSSVIQNVHE